MRNKYFEDYMSMGCLRSCADCFRILIGSLTKPKIKPAKPAI